MALEFSKEVKIWQKEFLKETVLAKGTGLIADVEVVVRLDQLVKAETEKIKD